MNNIPFCYIIIADGETKVPKEAKTHTAGNWLQVRGNASRVDFGNVDRAVDYL